LLFSPAKDCFAFVFQHADSSVVATQKPFTAPVVNSLLLVSHMRADADADADADA
jgi:hypothetical protein